MGQTLWPGAIGQSRGGDTWGRFVRVALDLLHFLDSAAGPGVGVAIRIPHAVGTLAGFWHAPLAEPAPLAVLSHGSSDFARRIQSLPDVARVLHPALDSCPGHEFWKRDFAGASGVFSVVLRPETAR